MAVPLSVLAGLLGRVEAQVTTATLVGHAVDAHGDLLTDGWRVLVLDEGPGPHPPGWPLDPATGAFTIRGLAPGRVGVRAVYGALAETRTQEVELAAGETREVILVLDGPHPRDLVGVEFGARASEVHPAHGSVVAIDARGTQHELAPRPTRRTWVAEVPGGGVCRIEVRDPRFQPVTQDRVPCGAVSYVQLRGTSAVEVTVVDAHSRKPLPNARVDLARLADPTIPREWPSGNRSVVSPGVHRFDEVVPGEVSIIASADRAPIARALLEGLAPGEVRRIELALGAAYELEGRLVDHNGVPQPGQRVALAPLRFESEFERSVGVDRSHLVMYRKTDAEGRFRFERLGPGPVTLRAHQYAITEVTAHVGVGAEPSGPVVLTIPAGASVR